MRKQVFEIQEPIENLPGVGPAKKNLLSHLHIYTIRDLLSLYPRGYENRANIRTLLEGIDGVESAFLLTIATAPQTIKLKNNMFLTRTRAYDSTGTIDIVFYNQPYVSKLLIEGKQYRFWGKLTFKNTWQLTSPEYEKADYPELLPPYISKYPLTLGLKRKELTTLVEKALSIPLADYLPEEIRLRNKLMNLNLAYRYIHQPDSEDHLNQAIRRLVFDELFFTALAVSKNRASMMTNMVPSLKNVDLSDFFASIPFSLTNDQTKFIRQLQKDFHSDNEMVQQMHRILIGDVGSGKTICAMAGIYLVIKNGYQAAIMAPTEILAKQHYSKMNEFFEKWNIRTLLLTGSIPQTKKKKLYEQVKNHEYDLVIGTHALLNKDLSFDNLLLTITDEQHRFGIEQRQTLENKTESGHLLVMSATPIPRSLALTFYGDLALSRIEEMPKGRQKIDTFVVNETYRDRINQFISKQIEMNSQVYIVCPAISEEEEITSSELELNSLSPASHPVKTLKNVTKYTENLKEALPFLQIEALHGKMKQKEKDEVMNRFVSGKTQVLVSTTVIEVGIDVPNATLMIIEDADRFGLAQLHQLRGRVGRGSKKSYCILISDSNNANSVERLKILSSSNDGFEIAEKDLMMRGPGDFFIGSKESEMRQSGGMTLKLAKCCDDLSLFQKAFQEADSLISKDPLLLEENHYLLSKEFKNYFKSTENNIS